MLKGAFGVGVVLQFVEELKVNCEVEQNGCCVLCGRDYCVSYVWPSCII